MRLALSDVVWHAQRQKNLQFLTKNGENSNHENPCHMHVFMIQSPRNHDIACDIS